MMREKFSIGNLVYELTEACNQNCRFCYNHWRPEGCRPVDGRLARKTLNRLLRQADPGVVSFSGGEPALLGNLHDLALKCRFRGASVNVLTNGTLLTEDDIVNLGSIGINGLQIPLLDAGQDIHDYLTGTAGSWEKACRAIRTAVRVLGADHFAAVLILTAKNVAGISGTLELYRELGVRTVLVNRFNPGGNGLKNRGELCLSREALGAAFRLVSDFSLRNPEMEFVSGVCTPVCVLEPSAFPGVRFTACSTEFRNRPVTVTYRGEVRFCNHSPFVLGNIWARDLKDILEDESIAARYSGIPEQCAGCGLFARCRGGCRAAAEQVYGSFDRRDPVAEL